MAVPPDKTAKETEASLEKTSITSQGCRIRLQPPSYAKCVPNCKAIIAKIGGPRFPIVALNRMPWAVLEEACLFTSGLLVSTLAEAILLHFPRSRLAEFVLPLQNPKNCQNCVQRLRPVGVMKRSSSVPRRRLREFTLVWADPVVGVIGTSTAHVLARSCL